MNITPNTYYTVIVVAGGFILVIMLLMVIFLNIGHTGHLTGRLNLK